MSADTDFASGYETSCNNNPDVGGFANPGLVVICLPNSNVTSRFPGSTATLQERREFAKLQGTITHEIYHAAQFQLTGQRVPSDVTERLAFWGPEWLLEGAAQYVALSSVYSGETLQSILTKKLSAQAVSTKEILNFSDVTASKEITANAGIVLVEPLARNVGASRLIAFYETLGLSGDWKVSFEKTFNITHEEYVKKAIQ